MRTELKEFIKANSNAIDKGQWEKVYSNLNAYADYLTGEFTEALLEIGIDPGKQMKKLPTRYLLQAKLPYYNIGSNIEELGNYAFQLSAIESALIPDNVKELGYGCFQTCTRLRYLTIGLGVEFIPEDCFLRCISLENVRIPDTVKIINSRAFAKCAYLKHIHLGRGITYIGASAFDGCDEIDKIDYDGTIQEWKNINMFSSSFSTKSKGSLWPPIHCIDGVIEL